MKKFNLKKWLTENKHGKANINYISLNEQTSEFRVLYDTLKSQIGDKDKAGEFLSSFNSMEEMMAWYTSTVSRIKQLAPKTYAKIPEPREFETKLLALKSKAKLKESKLLQEGWFWMVVGGLVALAGGLWWILSGGGDDPEPCPCTDGGESPDCCGDEGGMIGTGNGMGDLGKDIVRR